MKTLHINTEMTFRGGEQQTLYLVQGLRKRGHEAHLVCQPESGIQGRAEEARIPCFPLRMRGEFDPCAAVRLARLMRSQAYDLVHSHTSHAHSQVTAASFFLRKRPVRIVTRRVDFSIFRHNFLGLNIYKYTKGVDHVIVISRKIREVLIQDGVPADSISLVHSGVDPDRFKGEDGEYVRREFSLAPGTVVLGSVGFLEGHKGQQHLIQAMSTVVAAIPEVRLFLVGEGALERDLKALAQELGLSRHIVFTGFRRDVGAFLDVFDLLVVASVAEGLNTSILDALAMEVPVVATDAGGISEIITHQETGFLVPKADAQALATGILWMLQHRDRARAMASAGRQKVMEHFSASAMVEKNLAVYRKLITHTAE